jgi:hypothetical protein
MKRLVGFAVESNEVEEQFRSARSGPEIFHVWVLPFDPLSLKVPPGQGRPRSGEKRCRSGARLGGHLENRNQEQFIVYFWILGYRGGKVQYGARQGSNPSCGVLMTNSRGVFARSGEMSPVGGQDA